MEQEYILENCKSFEPEHIFECGQCFRWNKQKDGSYTGIFKQNVVNVKKADNKIIFRGICKENIKDECIKYFDLNTNYDNIKSKLSNVDNYLKTSIEYGEGIRILNQDLWETLISFIISANNNIPRIKGIIERISKSYGEKIVWDKAEYYTFPTPQELSKASVEDLRNIGLGFRDVRVYETTKIINENPNKLKELEDEKDVNKLREELLKFPGVGPKVADCVMLFSTLKKLEVFPIDVWVRRVMNELYIKNDDETKINKKEIEELAKTKYGNLAGIAQQYLFYWRRGA
ncbi:MAG TPA: 8-oxoguanine DNA glycosylase [Clostridiaceae bacterium]|nr:8-oxoguanine DNA-glycosylase (Ogg) [Clostridium sp. CAG:452]HJJ03400.1 8-oxoguanine DNA glycosylase [Clostridiaceae bacterium]